MAQAGHRQCDARPVHLLLGGERSDRGLPVPPRSSRAASQDQQVRRLSAKSTQWKFFFIYFRKQDWPGFRTVPNHHHVLRTEHKWKRTKKTYSPMDVDERKDKTQSTVSTIKCLRKGNINKLTQKTDREGRRGKYIKYLRSIKFSLARQLKH